MGNCISESVNGVVPVLCGYSVVGAVWCVELVIDT